MSTSDSFQQLALRFTDPVQHDYEVIRGLLLADETIAERSRLTGVDRDTISEKAQRFYLYAERGPSRRRVSIWLREGRLHIAYQEAILAQYSYHYDRKARRLREVDTPRIFETPYASPQLEFWELDDDQWHKFARRPYERHAVPQPGGTHQLALSV